MNFSGNNMNFASFQNQMKQPPKMPEKLQELIHLSTFESLSDFSSSISLKCMDHCHQEIVDEMLELSNESIRALEKQCTKSCFKKYSSARDQYLNGLNNSTI